VNSRTLTRFLILGGVLVLGWLLRTVTVPLIAAYLLCLFLLPWQHRLARRMGGSLAALTCLAGVSLVPVLLLLPVLLETHELAQLLPGRDQLAALAQGLYRNLESLRASLPQAFASALDFDQQQILELGQRLSTALLGLGEALLTFCGGMVGILSGLVLLPIFSFFLLRGAPWLPKLRRELPPEWRPSFDHLLPRILGILKNYSRARILVAGAKALIYGVMLWIGGLPGAYTLSLFAGVFSLLPVFGPFLAFLALALVAFADAGTAGLGFACAAYLVAEVIEAYVLLPRLVGRGIGLSDFGVILAVLCGGALFGVFGMLVAIPLTAVGVVLYDEFLRPTMTGEEPERDEARPDPRDTRTS